MALDGVHFVRLQRMSAIFAKKNPTSFLKVIRKLLSPADGRASLDPSGYRLGINFVLLL